MFLCHLVSVPYRGATFLNKNCKSLASAKRVSVPYRGATFLNFNITVFQIFFCIFQFPSPIGELHFSIICSRSAISRLLVSVPYRGATFLNCVCYIKRQNTVKVSVPYRGATFLNTSSQLSRKGGK